MKTHELVIEVDGKFTGTTSEVCEYLGIKLNSSGQVTKYANANKVFRGHQLKKIGVLKHHVLYGLFDENNTLVFKGTTNDIHEKYLVDIKVANYNMKNNFKLMGKYTVAKLGMIDILERT